MAELLYTPEHKTISREQASELFTTYSPVLGRIASGNFQSWRQPQISVEHVDRPADGFVMPDGKGLGRSNSPWSYAAMSTRFLMSELLATPADDDAYEYAKQSLQGSDAFVAHWNSESYVHATDLGRFANPDAPSPLGEVNDEQVKLHFSRSHCNSSELVLDATGTPLWEPSRTNCLHGDTPAVFADRANVATQNVTVNEYHLLTWIGAVIDEQLPALR